MNKLIHSFGYAVCGIGKCIRTERNFRIHLVALGCVIWMSRFYSFSVSEKAVLVVTCGMVMMGELCNSAVERSVDLCTQQEHPLAKDAKDMAAGAVLLSACMAVVVGVMLFGEMEGLTSCFCYFTEQPRRLLGLAGAALAALFFVFFPEKFASPK